MLTLAPWACWRGLKDAVAKKFAVENLLFTHGREDVGAYQLQLCKAWHTDIRCLKVTGLNHFIFRDREVN
jgi:hypothetical protein